MCAMWHWEEGKFAFSPHFPLDLWTLAAVELAASQLAFFPFLQNKLKQSIKTKNNYLEMTDASQAVAEII